jgi:hypothetical protein
MTDAELEEQLAIQGMGWHKQEDFYLTGKEGPESVGCKIVAWHPLSDLNQAVRVAKHISGRHGCWSIMGTGNCPTCPDTGVDHPYGGFCCGHRYESTIGPADALCRAVAKALGIGEESPPPGTAVVLAE